MFIIDTPEVFTPHNIDTIPNDINIFIRRYFDYNLKY